MASSSSNNFISELSEKKYINVETYRKNGQSVRTPVWFVVFNNKIYFRTDSNSGKVKRIMNNQNVRIAGCDLLGNIKTEWIKANAKIAKEVDHETVNSLINKKYFIIQSFIKIMYTLRKIKVIIISIEFS
jgi:PPOX class probable F420-dependent enzyme